MRLPVLTIGHSNHSPERVIALLRMHGVTAVADVRSSPFSRVNPQFNRESLAEKLKDSGIVYVYLGSELGARPADPGCYIEGRVQYRLLSETKLFRSGLRRILKGAQSFQLALLCAEKEPLACHRAILIARELIALGAPVCHILANGNLESHDQTLLRLLNILGMTGKDLYRDRDELISDAYAQQEQRIAYVKDVKEEIRQKASA